MGMGGWSLRMVAFGVEVIGAGFVMVRINASLFLPHGYSVQFPLHVDSQCVE